MSSHDQNQPTTFGAIIERKTPLSPAHTGSSTSKSSARLQSSLPPNATTPRSHSPIAPLHSSPVRPQLHLTSTTQAVDPPLPSPYSISDSPHEKALDLEAGTFKAPVVSQHAIAAPATPEPSNNTLSASAGGCITPSRQISSVSTASSSTAGRSTGVANEKLVDGRVLECTMWPTRDALKQKAKEEKAKRSRNPFIRLSKRNKVIVSVTIALTIIGAAVGIGVGVSRAYHGEVWAGNGRNVPIPS